MDPAPFTYNSWIPIGDSSLVLTTSGQIDPLAGITRPFEVSGRSRRFYRSKKRNPIFLTSAAGVPRKYPKFDGVGDYVIVNIEKIGDRGFLDADEMEDILPDALQTDLTEIAVAAVMKKTRAIIGANNNGDAPLHSTAASVDEDFIPGFSIYDSIKFGRSDGRYIQTAEIGIPRNVFELDPFVPINRSHFVQMKGRVNRSTRVQPANYRWLMDSAYEEQLDGLVDRNGQPLLGTTADGSGARMLGYPVTFAHGMSMVFTGGFRPIPTLKNNGVPPNALGVSGQYYVNLAIANGTAANRVYKKGAAAWDDVTAGNAKGQLAVGQFSRDGTSGTSYTRGSLKYDERTDTLLIALNNADAAFDENPSDIRMAVFGDWSQLVQSTKRAAEFLIGGPSAERDYDSVPVKYRERYGFAVGWPEAFTVLTKDIGEENP